RRFMFSFAIPREFANSLGSQQAQEISYALKRLAKEDTFSLRFRLLLAEDLPKFAVNKTFGAEVVSEGASEYIKSKKKTYRYYEWVIAQRPLQGSEERFVVEISPDGDSEEL